VFGARVAHDISGLGEIFVRPPREDRTEPRGGEIDHGEALRTLRETMQDNVGVIREGASLAQALGTIRSLESQAAGDRQLANMLTTAKLIAAAAYARKESRGAHFRSDFPQADPALARRSFIRLKQADTIAREAAETHDPAKTRLETKRHASAHA
jgi:L-aspartate oxidase